LARRLLTLPAIDSKSRVLLKFVLGILTALASTAQDKPSEAWWLRAVFLPSKTAYESLPATDINPDWVKISMLSYASLPSEAQADLGWMHRDGFHFQVDNYFKRTNLTDRELCGVFEDRAGHKGRFLLVLERPSKGPWKVSFLHQEVGEAGFSVLLSKPNGLFWSTCMQCGEFSRLRTKQSGFYLDQAP
jgi:hypothetical protein